MPDSLASPILASIVGNKILIGKEVGLLGSTLISNLFFVQEFNNTPESSIGTIYLSLCIITELFLYN
jgi:hypothetical protein